MKCKVSNQTNSLSVTVYSTSELLALGYTYIKHCAKRLWNKKRDGISENHTNSFNFDDILHNRAGFEACTLHHWILNMLIFQLQTRCTISSDVRNSTQENLQNKCSNLQFRNRTDSCREIQNKIIKSKSRSRFYKI